MSITGRHMDASQAPLTHFLPADLSSSSSASQHHRQLDESNPLEEEIFAKDGVIEDIIAVDYKTT